MKRLATFSHRLRRFLLPMQALAVAALTLAPATNQNQTPPPLPPLPATSTYQVREAGTSLEVTGPGGVKVFTSDLNFTQLDGYQVRIPLAMLAPPPPAPAPILPPDGKLPYAPGKKGDGDEDDQDEDSTDEEGEARSPRLKKSITVEYDDSDRMLVEANHLYNKRKYFQATEVVEELLRKKPKLVRAWIMKGSVLYVQGHKDMAKQAWTHAAELEPPDTQTAADIQHYLERYK